MKSMEVQTSGHADLTDSEFEFVKGALMAARKYAANALVRDIPP